MKQTVMSPKFVLTTFFTIFFTLTIYSQWQPVGEGLLPDTQRVASIATVDEHTVWGVSFYDRTPAPVPPDLIPHVFRTTDGGDNFEVHEIMIAQGRICQDIFAVNDSIAWITTNGLRSDSLRGIFKTTDGGKTWQEKFDGPAGGGVIHFFDDTIGIAMHDQFLAYTFDGGENWDNQDPLSTLPFDFAESVFYTAANNAFAIVSDTMWFGTTQGRIFRSLNRGFQWEAIETPFEDNDVIVSTSFRNAQEGIIISYAQMNDNAITFMDSTKVALTYDGGETWELADTIFNFKVSCMAAIPGSEFKFLGATNGLSTISSDSAQTWQHFSYRPYNSIDFLTEELGWVGNGQTSEDHSAIMYKWEGIVSSTPTVEENSLNIHIFPNPFSQNFQLKLSSDDFETYKNSNLVFKAFDLLGKEVWSQVITDIQSEIEFPDATSGIYFYQINTAQAVLASGRIILSKSR